MNATVQKWGNSLALRLPSSFTKDVHLHRGSVVDISLAEGQIVVTPKKTKKISLSALLKKITRENLHSEIDWGEPRGSETL